MEIEKKSFTEKRKIKRKKLVFYLRIFEGLSFKVLGHVVNLSAKGAMLLSDSELPVNRTFRLRMRMPKEMSDRPDLMLNATSCWSRKDGNPDFFLTGFRIHRLKTAEKNALLHLLEKFSY